MRLGSFIRSVLKTAPVPAAALALLVCCWSAAAAGELDYGLEEHLLRRIELTGNSTFDDGDLKSILKIREPRRFHPLMLLGLGDRAARYRPDLIDSELRLLERYYRQRGFHQVAVRLDSISPGPQGYGDDIHITIAEGPRTFLRGVTFPGGEEILPSDRLREGLTYLEGVPAPAGYNDLGPDIFRLRTRFWDEGYLRVEIMPEMVTSLADEPGRVDADLAYHIRPGLRYEVDRIQIEGLSRTRPHLVQRELTVAEGDVFSWRAIEQTRRNLLETALFRDVGLIPAQIDTVGGRTDLLLQLVERQPAYYELGFGTGTRERIRLLGAWGHNNLGGRGQRLRLSAKVALNYEDVSRLSDGSADPELNYRYDALYTRPRMLGRFQVDTGIFAEKETRGESGLNFRTFGFSVGTFFPGGSDVTNQVAFNFERSDPELHPDAKQTLRESFEAVDLGISSTHSLVWNLTREKRDDVLRPTRGTSISTKLETAGGPLGGDNSFVKGQASWHGYRETFLGGVIAVRFSVGVVRAYGSSADRGSEGVPYQDRFFAGGVSTVRGYQEYSLGPQYTDKAALDSLQLATDVPLPDRPARGGNYMMLSNAEWRFPVPLLRNWGVGGVLFMDGGNVWERADDIRLRGFRLRSYPRESDDPEATRVWDYRYSLGTGLRVDTPVGPVRLDVGFPLKRARLSETETEDKVIYHFSLGYPF